VTCYALGVTTIHPDHVSRRRVYDARVRELVCATGDPDLFPELNIPKSTLRGWINGEFEVAIGAQSISRTEIELYAKIAKLRRRIQALQAVMCLLLAVVRVTGCRLDGERLPDGAAKGHILKAIGKATRIIALSSALKVIGLSKSRYHTWKRTEAAVRRLVAFYVQQYNELMPHSALNFRTPDEVYFGKAEDVPRKLSVARRAAREARLTTNRTTTCEACSASTSSATAFSEAA